MIYNVSDCQQQSEAGCDYMILVTNPSYSITSYELTAFHSQKNHILLQEGKAYMDSVENRHVRYYKYSIVDD